MWMKFLPAYAQKEVNIAARRCGLSTLDGKLATDDVPLLLPLSPWMLDAFVSRLSCLESRLYCACTSPAAAAAFASLQQCQCTARAGRARPATCAGGSS